MLWREQRLLYCYTSIIALLIKGLRERTLVYVEIKLVGYLCPGLKPLLARRRSVRDQPLAERSI